MMTTSLGLGGRTRVFFFFSLLTLTACAVVVNGQFLSHSVDCDNDQVIVTFEGAPTSVTPTIPWIGLYRDQSLTNLPTLPTVDQGNLLDWQYTCGGSCGNGRTPPRSGTVTLDAPPRTDPPTILRVVLSDDDSSASVQTSAFNIQDECDGDGGDGDDEEGRIDDEPAPEPAPESEPQPQPAPEPEPEQSEPQQCNARNSQRRRRPWRALSCGEQEEFMEAVDRLHDEGGYEEFIQVHIDMNDQSHQTEEFLPVRWCCGCSLQSTFFAVCSLVVTIIHSLTLCLTRTYMVVLFCCYVQWHRWFLYIL
jgi:hypothetical protein